MPNPSHSALHISQPLTDVSVARFEANKGFYAAEALFPAVGVTKQANKYYTYDAGDLRRSEAKYRAPGAPVAMGGYKVSSDSYFCDRLALGRGISDPERDNADENFDLDNEAAEYLTDQIEQGKEISWAGDFFTTGVWSGGSASTDLSGAASSPSTSTAFLQWNDVASTPIEDIRGEIVAMQGKTGPLYRANKLALGPHTYRWLQDHPDILDRIKNTVPGSPATINRELLAGLFELDQVVVLAAVRNTAVEQAADAVSYIAGKHALLLYTPKSAGLKTPAAGYTFKWTAGGKPMMGSQMKRYRDEKIESDMVEAENWFDFKKVSGDLGQFFSGAVA